jgi:hypothetical protein
MRTHAVDQLPNNATGGQRHSGAHHARFSDALCGLDATADAAGKTAEVRRYFERSSGAGMLGSAGDRMKAAADRRRQASQSFGRACHGDASVVALARLREGAEMLVAGID